MVDLVITVKRSTCTDLEQKINICRRAATIAYLLLFIDNEWSYDSGRAI